MSTVRLRHELVRASYTMTHDRKVSINTQIYAQQKTNQTSTTAVTSDHSWNSFTSRRGALQTGSPGIQTRCQIVNPRGRSADRVKKVANAIFSAPKALSRLHIGPPSDARGLGTLAMCRTLGKGPRSPSAKATPGHSGLFQALVDFCVTTTD